MSGVTASYCGDGGGAATTVWRWTGQRDRADETGGFMVVKLGCSIKKKKKGYVWYFF